MLLFFWFFVFFCTSFPPLLLSSFSPAFLSSTPLPPSKTTTTTTTTTKNNANAGFVWWAQQAPNNAIAYASIAPSSGDLSGTTVAVTGLPATSSFLAFGQGDRLYSASFDGKVTRCVYTFQALSKALGSTPYPPVVNQCKRVTAHVGGAAVAPVLGFAVGPSNY